MILLRLILRLHDRWYRYFERIYNEALESWDREATGSRR